MGKEHPKHSFLPRIIVTFSLINTKQLNLHYYLTVSMQLPWLLGSIKLLVPSDFLMNSILLVHVWELVSLY